MDTDDGWPKVWAEMSDEELRDRLVTICFSRRTLRIAMQNALRNSRLLADKRGKAEMVDEAMEWAKSHKPSKQE